MSAAQGPHCEGGCGKRMSKRTWTTCPWCRTPVCLNCKCPNRCYRCILSEAERVKDAAENPPLREPTP